MISYTELDEEWGQVSGATNFNVANYVGDGEVAIQSRTKTLFGSDNGYFRFRLVPGGMEGGKNIQSTGLSNGASSAGATSSSTSVSEDYVARVKGGGTFTLFYDNQASLLPFKHIELDLETVQRYLFYKESEKSSATASPVLSAGYRPWYEADGLLYLAETPSGSYGFRLTYNNGSLPPNFAITKSFNFGFVYQTGGAQTSR